MVYSVLAEPCGAVHAAASVGDLAPVDRIVQAVRLASEEPGSRPSA